MNKYQALVDMLEHGNSKGALDALEKLRDEDREKSKCVEESNIIEKDGDYYIKFVAHEEVVKRNRQQTRKERDAEIVEWVKKEIRNAPLEVKMSGSSMILGKLINHLTTPDHE